MSTIKRSNGRDLVIEPASYLRLHRLSDIVHIISTSRRKQKKKKKKKKTYQEKRAPSSCCLPPCLSPTYRSPSQSWKSRFRPWLIGSISAFRLLHVVVLPRTHSHPLPRSVSVFTLLPDTFTPSNLNPLKFACALPTLHCSASKAPVDCVFFFFFFVCG